jgi:ubiquinone/menaquinone biosynthesis C-methylase UbiE
MTTDYFDRVAEEWDDLRAGMYSQAVRDAALERAALHPQSIAVDLGAGTGFIAEGLAPRVARLHLVDSSPEMLAVARRNLAGYTNVEYHLADGAHIPLPDASVDAVLANMYLHHAPDPAAAIREMARLLRPGGRLVITDLDEHSFTWLREEHADLWLGFNRQQVREWFQAAGLVNLRVEDTAEACASTSQMTQERASVSIFVASGARPQPGMQQAVQEHYRQVALAGSSCCGPSQTPASPDASLLAAIPLDVIQPAGSTCCASDPAQAEADLSLGCGSPVELARLRPGEVVLDIGSGAGADVFPAARLVGPQGRVIGLDMLEEMLARARATAEKHGYQNVEFRQGDAGHIPLPDGSIDVVMSNCVINLVQDKGQAFREIQRVLRPGGRLAVSDIVTDRPFSPAYQADPESWAACVSGALPESEYLALISQAGFSEIVATRSQAWPAGDGTRVYSLKVKAQKNG